jgi:xylulose-5-phosphate/fructose-6-phosphate phosphoketolase
MIVMRSPKGWTGPKEVDGLKVEGFWRAHQVPIANPRGNPEHLRLLEEWMRSYRIDDLFDKAGRLLPELQALAPQGRRRMGANPHANGGLLKRELKLPDFRDYAVDVPHPGGTEGEATRVMGAIPARRHQAERRCAQLPHHGSRRDSIEPARRGIRRDRARLDGGHRAVRCPPRPGRPGDGSAQRASVPGLAGRLSADRPPRADVSCYEAFIHIVDSMFNQHAKWLKVSRALPWRRPVASLNYLLTSHVWRQDHNGFSHQDPGFVDLVANKKADIVRIYFPPDANTLLWITDHVLRTYDRINVIVAGKQPSPQWLGIEEAATHCDAGIGIWPGLAPKTQAANRMS